MIYLTSDFHFNHNKEFIYKSRGFESIDEMNEVLVENFNKTVSSNDVAYILGDLMLGGPKNTAIDYIKKLSCGLYIIKGNHDTDTRIKLYQECWNVIDVQNAEYLKYNGYHFYLSHYPTITSEPTYEKKLKSRLICLFGHTHSSDKFYNENPYMYNVAVDAHACKPVSIEDILNDILLKEKEITK